MSSEDWDALHEEAKEKKRIREKANRELIDMCTAEYGLEVGEIHNYHLRIQLGDKKLDYFPQSGKATWLGSGRWFVIGDIEKFIKNELKVK